MTSPGGPVEMPRGPIYETHDRRDVMNIRKKALMDVAGIRCTFQGEDGPAPARVAFVTEATLREALKHENGKVREQTGLRYGSVIAYVQDRDGPPREEIFPPGAGDSFLLDDIPFLGQDMLAARDLLASRSDRGQTLSGDEARALEGLRDVFGMVSAAPDERRFPVHLIAQSYEAALSDAFGPLVSCLDHDHLVRKGQADLVRAGLSALDPEHSDGISRSTDLGRVLDRAGADIHHASSAAGERTGTITSEDARRIATSSQRLSEEVFAAVTIRRVGDLDVSVISASDTDAVRDALTREKLSGPWVAEIERRVTEITRSGTGGYRFDMSLHAKGGRDLLIVSDNVSRAHGAGIVYSWPSAERAPVVETESGRVVTISPEEVPSIEEVDRLRTVLHDLQATRAAEPVMAEND